MNKTVLLILIFLSAVWSLKLFAHPHMSIETSCEFNFQDSELKGFWVEFHFDKYFTLDMFNGFDENKDSLFDAMETEHIYNSAFINLKNYGFFISIREGDERKAPTAVSDFSVLVDHEILVYRFFILYESPEKKEVYISISDPTYFCAVSFLDDPVTFSGSENLRPKFSIMDNKDSPVYYDPLAPANDNRSYDKWEPGLQAHFPEEIHLEY